MSGAARTVDRELELRERLVETIDAIDRDDPGTARFFAQGILDDLDREIADEGPAT